MKSFITVISFVFSLNVMSAEFFAKFDNITCAIKNNEISRTFTMGKETKASFTEIKKVTLNGFDELVTKVALVSSPLPTDPENFEGRYYMTHEGKDYALSVKDSKDSMVLIRLISNMCL